MQKPEPIDEEYHFEKGLIISSTDLNGSITYANRNFCEITGYTKDEFTRRNHNIIRHPDMPKATFAELWKTIQSKKEWSGILKNLRKDGRYYWGYSHVIPTITNGKVTGFTAVKRPVSKSETKETLAIYTKMLEKENN